MSYKTILVCVTNLSTAERLIKAACVVARKFNAHLVGLHVQQSMEVYSGITVDLPRQTTEAFNAEQSQKIEKVKQLFDRHTAAEDFVSEWRHTKGLTTNPSNRYVEHAHCADLVIMSQADPQTDDIDQSDMLEALIKRSGRPVLVIPSAGTFETFGSHALMGWSATRESSRAVHDAIPFVADGGDATVLWVSTSDKNAAYLENTAHATASCLDRYGIKVSVARWQNSEIAIGDALLNEAFERGADMIVTGAFGHSKFYDFVIGATTSNLLDQMTVPVLFSH